MDGAGGKARRRPPARPRARAASCRRRPGPRGSRSRMSGMHEQLARSRPARGVRPIVSLAGAGQPADEPGGAGGRRVSAGSCARIMRSSRRSSGPGSSPELVDQQLPSLAHGLQRLGLPPARYSATISCPRSRSRSGCSATSACSSPTRSSAPPRPAPRPAAPRSPPAAAPPGGRSRAARTRRSDSRPAPPRATAPAPSAGRPRRPRDRRDRARPARGAGAPRSAGSRSRAVDVQGIAGRPMAHERDALAEPPAQARDLLLQGLAAPPGGASPHSASTSSSVETASGARSASAANSRRCFAPSN